MIQEVKCGNCKHWSETDPALKHGWCSMRKIKTESCGGTILKTRFFKVLCYYFYTPAPTCKLSLLVAALLFCVGCATTTGNPKPHNADVNQFYYGGNPALWWYYQ